MFKLFKKTVAPKNPAYIPVKETALGKAVKVLPFLPLALFIVMALSGALNRNADAIVDTTEVVVQDVRDSFIRGFNRETGFGLRNYGGIYMKAYKDLYNDNVVIIEGRFAANVVAVIGADEAKKIVNESLNGDASATFRQYAELVKSFGIRLEVVFKNSDGAVLGSKLF